MRAFPLALTAAAILSAAAAASLPRLAVVSLDTDDFSPDQDLIHAVTQELVSSSRFDVVDLGASAFITGSPDSLMTSLMTLAAENNLDTFLALELLPVEESDRTVFRNDSLITYRSVGVTLLGRFYSSTGTLIGTITQTRTAEDILPFSADRDLLGRQAAVDLARRSILELFPLEVTFTVSGDRLFTIPIGSIQGIDGGTIMSVVASSTALPSDPTGYANLRSHGLLQVIRSGDDSSTARLLSGKLVEGASVTAVEQSAPAVIFAGYSGGSLEAVPGSGLSDEVPAWSNGVRLGVATGKWGFSLGGGISASILERASALGVDLCAGIRMPVSSPALGLRLSGGVEMLFLLQDVRSDTLSSSATATAVNGVADAALEWLFTDHLGLEISLGAVLGASAETWTVQEYTGQIRDANPDELFYRSMRERPLTVRAGLMYMVF
jgi:hypothetical protein